MKTTHPESVDLGHYPFRGIFTEIAREDGVSRQAVQQAARAGNPRILRRVAEKIEERRAMVTKFDVARAPNQSGAPPAEAGDSPS
ncbi:MAG TPA: hypothetical protein VHI13_06590 [Candidatus Kapabacteria bacterium]|nr:hypothetical protein [Candidatus Kapabacteria bacterium]